MSFLGESEGKQIQTLTAWASIAYAFGFLTVMMHTAKLGIPVIQILQPIYIWIGLPLALVVFSLRWLEKVVRSQVNDIRNELLLTRDELTKTLLDRNLESEEVTDLVDAVDGLSATLPLIGIAVLSSALSSSVTLFATKILDLVLKADQFRPILLRVIRLYTVYLKVMTTLIRTYRRTVSFLNFVFVISLIPILCLVYIFFIYPMIPQSIGGGQPTPVTMILVADKIPTNSTETQNLFPPNVQSSQNSKAITTVELKLLYSTDSSYFVQNNNFIISISKDAVEGIIWRR